MTVLFFQTRPTFWVRASKIVVSHFHNLAHGGARPRPLHDFESVSLSKGFKALAPAASVPTNSTRDGAPAGGSRVLEAKDVELPKVKPMDLNIGGKDLDVMDKDVDSDIEEANNGADATMCPEIEEVQPEPVTTPEASPSVTAEEVRHVSLVIIPSTTINLTTRALENARRRQQARGLSTPPFPATSSTFFYEDEVTPYLTIPHLKTLESRRRWRRWCLRTMDCP
ncbi:hypothetical protein C1H46_000966 [Malus baccata]|uniref:Uncharacterized protein n=1 Tax=Malus baccata TaxID=106549 RepID=A0A540NQU2_MALBA|nr:hypothetical protein C1H46_000966 [Malus baccata]